MNKKISTLLTAALVVASMSSSVMAKDVLPNGERYYQLVNGGKALTYLSKDGKDSLVVATIATTDLDAYKKSLWSVKAVGTNYEFTNRVLGTTLSISTSGVTKDKDAAAYLGSGISAFAGDNNSPLKIDDATFAPSSVNANAKVKLFSNIPAADLTKADSVYYLSVAANDVVRVKKEASNTNATEFTLTSASSAVALSADNLNKLGNDAFKLTFLDAKGAAIETTLNNPFTDWITAEASPILKTGAKFDNYAALSTAIGKPKEGLTAASGIYQAIEKIDAYKKAYDEYLAVVNKWIAAKAGSDNEKVTAATGYTAKKNALFNETANTGAAAELLASTQEIEDLFSNAEKMTKPKKDDATVEAGSLGIFQAYEKVAAAVNTELYSVKTNVAALNSNLASLIVVDQTKTGNDFKALDAYKAADKAAKAIDAVKTLCESTTVQSYFAGFSTKLSAITVTAPVKNTDGYVTLKNAEGKYIAVDTTYIAEADKHLGFKLEKDANKIFGFPYTASFKVSQILDNPKVDQLIVKTYAFDAPTESYSKDYEKVGYTWASATGVITPDADEAEVVIRTLGTSGNYRREVSVEITTGDAELRKNAVIVFGEPAIATLEAGTYYIYNATTDVAKKDLAAVSYKAGSASQSSLASAMVGRSASEFVPSTQWNVTVKDGVYTFVNREYKDSVLCKLFDVEGKAGLYTNLSKDTIRVEKVTITGDAAHVGYKYYSPEVMEVGNFTLKMNALNQPVDFYVYMNADSVLMADATDEAKALKLVALNGQAGVERKLTDKSLSATTYQLVAMDEDGETPLYLTKKSNNVIALTTEANNNTIELKAKSADQYMIVWGKDDIAKASASAVEVFTVNQDGYVLLTSMNAPNNYTFNLMNENVPKYWDMRDANGAKDSIISISFESTLKNILLSVNNGLLSTRDLNELGAKEDTLSVGFKLDTARVYREDNFRPAYYICQNRVELEGDSVQANYLYVATDSLNNGTAEGKKLYSYNGYARLAMAPAIHIGDKMLLGADKKEATAAQLRNFNFAFKKIDGTEYADGYTIEGRFNNSSWGELAIINSIPVIVEAGGGETFSNLVGGGSVDNEKVEVSTISVVASDGAIIVKGAQGKKVAISNVLGQTIANTVLSSDEATIAVPAGVVVVAVEGEAAVKAIVK